MSRTKKIPFADALDIFLETAAEEEIRDAIASVKAWAQQRKFGFRVRIEPLTVPKDQQEKIAGTPQMSLEASK